MLLVEGGGQIFERAVAALRLAAQARIAAAEEGGQLADARQVQPQVLAHAAADAPLDLRRATPRRVSACA